MVDRPEPVAAGGVVGPAAGNALVAGWLGSRLAVRGVVDVVVDVGKSSLSSTEEPTTAMSVENIFSRK